MTDLLALIKTLEPVFLALIPVLLLYVKGASDRATEAATAARATAQRAAIGVEAVKQAVNGRIDTLLTEIHAKIDLAFERGRSVGHDEAAIGPLAEGQEKLEAHLKAQDAKSEARHEEIKNGPPKT